MTLEAKATPNLRQAVPFFAVSDIEKSVHYTTDVPEETEYSEAEG
jgi:hypothetical protein